MPERSDTKRTWPATAGFENEGGLQVKEPRQWEAGESTK